MIGIGKTRAAFGFKSQSTAMPAALCMVVKPQYTTFAVEVEQNSVFPFPTYYLWRPQQKQQQIPLF
eukprot:2523229-Amphidinium_carterae.1